MVAEGAGHAVGWGDPMSADASPRPTRLAIVIEQRERALERIEREAESSPGERIDDDKAATAAHWCAIHDSLRAEARREAHLGLMRRQTS